MFLFLLRLAHSFGRNILVYFAPFILILVSINLNITNPSIYKNSLIQNSFYNKLSSQATQIINQNPQVNNILRKNFEFITDSKALQKNTEQNIDSLSLYLNGNDIASSNLPSNLSNPSRSLPENIQILDVISSLSPDELVKFKDSLTQISNLNLLNVSSFLDWQKIPSIQLIRNFIQNFRWQINILGFLYFGVLLLVAFTSPLFSKNLFQELGIILSRVGLSSLFGIGIFLFGILATMWGGSLFNQYLLPILNVRPVIELISWQVFWICYNILSFAIYFSVLSFGSGYFLKKLSP